MVKMNKIKLQIKYIFLSLFNFIGIAAKSPFNQTARHRLGELYQLVTYPFFGKQYVSLSELLQNNNLEVSISPLKANIHNVNEFELLSICALIKDSNANQLFEIGTYDGRTTKAMAMNISERGHIYTLNLPPDTDDVELQTSDVDVELSKKVISGEQFLNTSVEKKITQLWGDSAKFDFSVYQNKLDLVFIDGAHSEHYVESDTSNAIKLIKPDGGIILWHDAHLYGVKDYFIKRYKNMPVYFIRNTSLAIMKIKEGKPHDILVNENNSLS